MHVDLSKQLPLLLAELFGELSPRAWLTGGSLLMADLGAPYLGDYDLLIEGTNDELSDVLQYRQIPFYLNLKGSLKVPLASGETIDLRAVGDAQPSDVLAALETYHFDIVSAAREIGGDEHVISTEARRRSIASKSFGFNVSYEPDPQFAAGILKAMATYERFLRFKCEDARANSFRRMHQKTLAPSYRRPEDAIRSIYVEIDQLNEVMAYSTLCRGVVRRIALGGFDEWDDFDILVPMGAAKAIDILERGSTFFSLNHFGMPKLRGKLGRTFDLICYDAPPAKTCSSFCMSSDRIIWPRESMAPHDLGGYLSKSPPDLHLSATGDALLVDRDERYYLIKAIFLCVLEGARLSADVEAALRRTCPLDIRDRRNISNLSIELVARGFEDALSTYLDKHGDAEADSILDRYSQFHQQWRIYVETSSAS